MGLNFSIDTKKNGVLFVRTRLEAVGMGLSGLTIHGVSPVSVTLERAAKTCCASFFFISIPRTTIIKIRGTPTIKIGTQGVVV